MKIHQVTDTVHMVTGTNVNWALITDGDAVTVVDAGYPNDAAAVLRSIRAIGRRPEDVEAILLTHAHLDHMGGIPALLSAKRVPVLTGPAEVAHAHREHTEQITPRQMLQQCTTRHGIAWVAHTLRAVLPHASMKVLEAEAAPYGTRLDIPGALIPISTPGHTTGHTAFLLEDQGILFSGDAIVTAHPLSPGPTRPQFLPAVFSENPEAMRASLTTLADLPADILVPGHGPIDAHPIRHIVEQLVSAL